MPVFKLTAQQLEAFERDGVVRIPDFYTEGEIAALADPLWVDLEQRFGASRDRPATWTVARPAKFQTLVRSRAFDAAITPKMKALADALLGAGGWEHRWTWGGPLVTFPTPTSDMPLPLWHIDGSPGRHLKPLPILIGFALLAPLRPNGGGTLYLAGSHRVVMDMACRQDRPMKSTAVRSRLKAEHPWFARVLSAKSPEVPDMIGWEAQVAGADVLVEQMTGEAGDLILMHPAMLHGVAHNWLDTPRLMLKVILTRRT